MINTETESTEGNIWRGHPTVTRLVIAGGIALNVITGKSPDQTLDSHTSSRYMYRLDCNKKKENLLQKRLLKCGALRRAAASLYRRPMPQQ